VLRLSMQCVQTCCAAEVFVVVPARACSFTIKCSSAVKLLESSRFKGDLDLAGETGAVLPWVEEGAEGFRRGDTSLCIHVLASAPTAHIVDNAEMESVGIVAIIQHSTKNPHA
jgi:hypothetical protein